MTWAVEWGAHYERARADGPVPPRLRPPEIREDCEGWLSDFWELSTDRQMGMAVGPIPAASLARHTAGMSEAEAEFARRVFRAMDRAFLKAKPVEGDTAVLASANPAMAAFRGAFG